MKPYRIDYDDRVQEVSEFFGYPKILVDCLFRYSKEFFEGSWGAFERSGCVDAYYSANYYMIRQMSYNPAQALTVYTPWLDEITGSCIDYACGAGDLLIYLAQKGVKCYAVEHKGVPVEFLKYRFDRHGVDVTIIEDGNIPEVDYTILSSALDHMPDPIAIAKMLCAKTRKKVFASPCIDETYDRPTHEKHILKNVPTAFDIIKEHNAHLVTA